MEHQQAIAQDAGAPMTVYERQAQSQPSTIRSLSPMHLLSIDQRRTCVALDERRIAVARRRRAFQRAINDLSTYIEMLLHVIGLERLMVVRVMNESGEVQSLQIATFGIRLSEGQFVGWQVHGKALEPGGMVSARGMVRAHFCQARIERRTLSGQWVLIVDTRGARPWN